MLKYLQFTTHPCWFAKVIKIFHYVARIIKNVDGFYNQKDKQLAEDTILMCKNFQKNG